MREKFAAMLKDAMKAGDRPRVSTVRLIQAALKDRDIEARGAGKTVSDDDILGLLQKMTKQRQESLAIYEKAGREDLASQERAEIGIIAEFLPKAMDGAEVEKAIAAAVAETGAKDMKDMGRVIGLLRQRFAGRMDFAAVSPLVKKALAG